MVKRTHARRYAQAVFEIALAAKQLEKWQEDLGKIVTVVGDAAFAAYLESPKVRFSDKDKRLSERLGTVVSPLALNLVRLLITKGRLDTIGDVAEEYRRLLDTYHGVEQAEVITAFPLDDDAKKKAISRLEEIADKKLAVKTTVDASLIGGMVARIGGKLLDGSTRSRLAALRKQVAGVGK